MAVIEDMGTGIIIEKIESLQETSNLRFDSLKEDLKAISKRVYNLECRVSDQDIKMGISETKQGFLMKLIIFIPTLIGLGLTAIGLWLRFG